MRSVVAAESSVASSEDEEHHTAPYRLPTFLKSLGLVLGFSAAAITYHKVMMSRHPEEDMVAKKPRAFVLETDLVGLSTSAMDGKGLTLDDTTFIGCSDRMLSQWPHTSVGVKYLRIFSASPVSNPKWDKQREEEVWNNIATWIKANNASVLVGTMLSCNEHDDDLDWENAKKLLKLLGPESVMGVAIGNELELMWTKWWVSRECVEYLWDGGYVIRKLLDRVRDLDKMPGFDKVPVTSVIGGAALAGWPFQNEPHARIANMIRAALRHFGDRWVFTFNFYPYFDPKLKLDPGTNNECKNALRFLTCFDSPRCDTIAKIRSLRIRMQEMYAPNNKLWIGETGWSWPRSTTLNTDMAHCPEFSSEHVFKQYYENFLNWDLSIGPDRKPPDMAFYFTMRDSKNGGFVEHFGLVGWCNSTTSKMMKDAEEEALYLAGV
eukprot:TRINITY_DN76106_c0_g1_i1.p1 TRINITY_DN76106_c0_g1~~TRINITY_DN76106_c0_g1_i1.p1  ORF type:complete len:435 (+),score=60.25 TRINITY_DN76106_c0_g1_i1:105-1409(+)